MGSNCRIGDRAQSVTLAASLAGEKWASFSHLNASFGTARTCSHSQRKLTSTPTARGPLRRLWGWLNAAAGAEASPDWALDPETSKFGAGQKCQESRGRKGSGLVEAPRAFSICIVVWRVRNSARSSSAPSERGGKSTNSSGGGHARGLASALVQQAAQAIAARSICPNAFVLALALALNSRSTRPAARSRGHQLCRADRAERNRAARPIVFGRAPAVRKEPEFDSPLRERRG